jgi:hypothetical protein
MIWWPSGDEELYDLRQDPAEVVNLATAPAYACIREALKDSLIVWLAHSEWRWNYRW